LNLSIVIPVYNAKKYLKRSIESVLLCGNSEVELILVDDGSDDGSLEVCESYINSSAVNVKVFNQNNLGVSAARNLGIDNAKGEYIMFLDADDYFADDWYDLVKKQIEALHDFIIYGYKVVYKDKRSNRLIVPYLDGMIKNSQFIKTLITSTNMNYCWGKVYKSRILKVNKLNFDETLKMGEDVDFQIKYLKYCESIKFCSNILVNYTQNNDSVTHKYGLQRFKDLEHSYYLKKELLQSQSLNSDELDLMYIDFCSVLISYTYRYCCTGRFGENVEDLKKIYSKRYIEDIIKNVAYNKLDGSRRIIAYLLKNKCIPVIVVLFMILSFIKRDR